MAVVHGIAGVVGGAMISGRSTRLTMHDGLAGITMYGKYSDGRVHCWSSGGTMISGRGTRVTMHNRRAEIMYHTW